MKGLIAAVPTPVDESLAPVKAAFLEHCTWALAAGCDGLNVLGTTGEANSLGMAQRKQVMSWAAGAIDPERLMVGSGLPSLHDTLELTRLAAGMGYRVALVLPPFYYKPVGNDGLVGWYEALDRALGSVPIEICFYNYPQMTGTPIPVEVVERLAKRHPHRFTGIKDSSGDLDYCRTLAARLPGFKVFPGSETALGESAASGFAGCISATVNITAPLCARLLSEGDTNGLGERITALRAEIAGQPIIPSVKYLVGRRSGDEVWQTVLPPFVPLETASRRVLDAIAASLNAPEQDEDEEAIAADAVRTLLRERDA
ncbi:dihydrodipicolinate synthase family protein [Rhodobacterales bacterium]|nr:dihydrodipicolinate synthase family protein [Rhodobacterales bacterium]